MAPNILKAYWRAASTHNSQRTPKDNRKSWTPSWSQVLLRLAVQCTGGFAPTASRVYITWCKDSLAWSLELTFEWPARYKNEANYAGMGECHLCENISSIDALILMTRMTFVSHTLELDKYRRKMLRPQGRSLWKTSYSTLGFSKSMYVWIYLF